MHTLLDYDGNLPSYVNITKGKTADNKGVYSAPLLKGSVIGADRFYNDSSLLNTRPKSIISNGKTQMASLQSSGIYTIGPFCQD